MLKPKQSTDVAPVAPAARARPKSRWLLVVIGLAVVAVGAWPAWQRARYTYAMHVAHRELQANRFENAIEVLQLATRMQPKQAEARYRLAVAYRRSGQIDKVELQLKAAEEHGWSKRDIERQRLLIHAQVGHFLEVEDQLVKMFEGELSDEAALEVYESLSHGYWANHQITDAIKCLDFWIKWHPQDIEPRIMRAEAYSQFNDPASAEREYREALKYAPEHGPLHELLANLLLEGGKVEEAEQHFVFCYEHGHRPSSVYFGLAECAYRSTRVEDADRWLAGIQLDELPEETQAKVLKLMADIAQFRREQPKAVSLLERALQIWPHDSAVHQSLGQAYAAIGRGDEAEKHLALAKEITARADRFYNAQRQVIAHPNDPELRYMVGDILAVQGLVDDATSWWRSALRCDAGHQPSHEAMAKYFESKGALDLAQKHRAAAEASVPNTFRRGWEQLADGNLVGAQQQLMLVERYPAYGLQARILQAGLMNKDGKYAEVLSMLQIPIEDRVLKTCALILSGEALIGLGKPLDAEQLFRQAIELIPQAVEAHRWLAVVYYDLGATTMAEVFLKNTADLAPKDYRPLRLLGLINKDFEAYDQAADFYRESMRRNPDQPSREEVLVELAECLIKQRDYDGALEVLNQALPTPQRDVLQAECLYNKSQTQEAIKILDRLLAENPDLATAKLLRGDAYLLEGKLTEAVKLLKSAVDANPYDYETRFRYAQALLRAGDDQASQAELARSEELKQIRERFSKLHEQAFNDPYSVGIRRELAATATQMGRPDLAEVWTRAAEVLESNPPPPVDPAAGKEAGELPAQDSSGTSQGKAPENAASPPPPADKTPE